MYEVGAGDKEADVSRRLLEDLSRACRASSHECLYERAYDRINELESGWADNERLKESLEAVLEKSLRRCGAALTEEVKRECVDEMLDTITRRIEEDA